MLRCEFLCHVLKALFFIKIALKLLFLQNNAKFSSAGGSAPRPPNQPPIANFGLPPGCRYISEAIMGRRRNELRNAAGLILKLRIIVAVQDLKIIFYMQILFPPLLASAPSLRLLWRRHCVDVWFDFFPHKFRHASRTKFWGGATKIWGGGKNNFLGQNNGFRHQMHEI